MKKCDVVTLGEVLIDFTPCGVSPAGQPLFERNAGGAPANVAVAVAQLGGTSSFIGMTGADSFGAFLRGTIKAKGVDVSCMKETSDQHTTLAFITLSDSGERSFSFCRNPGADTLLTERDLDNDLLSNASILHVGSLSLTDEPSRSATFAAIRRVREAGGLVSYDPNWRAPLWRDREAGIDHMRSLFPLADIVKVSDEEIPVLFGEANVGPESFSSCARRILDEGPRLVLITLGSRGVFYKTRDTEGVVDGFPVTVVDTTGAGDSFVGAVLYCLSGALRAGKTLQSRGARDLSLEELEASLRFANAVAALCVTRRGAIPAMPTLPEVTAFLHASGAEV